MPAISAYAPGKAILFGEHAVVYSRPAIAVPVTQVQARAAVFADIRAPVGQVWIDAPDIRLSARLADLPATNAMARLCNSVLKELGLPRFPALRLRVTSTIPIAAGLGSGAAISVAILRALSTFLGKPLTDERISALAFEQEKIYHGTPSGIDNTVIAYAQPIFYVRGQPFELLKIGAPFSLVIGDTGIRSSTAQAVGGVRERREKDLAVYERLFDQIAEIASKARRCLGNGEIQPLGSLMNANHELLRQIGVSNPGLDWLVGAAQQAGAWGAKLSGAGQGGNMIALVDPPQVETVAAALRAAGAVRTWVSQIAPQSQTSSVTFDPSQG